jgi:hypothetical protein
LNKIFPILLLLIIPNISHTCTVTSGVVTNANDSTCYTQPDYYSIKLLKLYLCTSKPGEPTTSSAADLSACHILAEGGSSGITVTLEDTSSSTILSGGTFTRVPDGIYTYAYIRLDNVISLKMDKEFENSSVGATGGVGKYCATVTGNGDEKVREISGSSVCSSSDDLTAGIWTSTFNAFNMSGSANVGTNKVSLSGFFPGKSTEMDIFLTLTDGKRVDALADRNTVDYIEATQSFESPVVIEKVNLMSVNIAVGISTGIAVWDPTSGATNKMEFSPGPFVTDISVTNY